MTNGAFRPCGMARWDRVPRQRIVAEWRIETAMLAAYAILLIAARLEAGGDALIRLGLHHHQGIARFGWFLTGAAALFVYGLSVNAPAINAPYWDFGRLLGVYVTLFFVVAQAINWLVFGAPPTTPILAGGMLIIAGAC